MSFINKLVFLFIAFVGFKWLSLHYDLEPAIDFLTEAAKTCLNISLEVIHSAIEALSKKTGN